MTGATNFTEHSLGLSYSIRKSRRASFWPSAVGGGPARFGLRTKQLESDTDKIGGLAAAPPGSGCAPSHTGRPACCGRPPWAPRRCLCPPAAFVHAPPRLPRAGLSADAGPRPGRRRGMPRRRVLPGRYAPRFPPSRMPRCAFTPSSEARRYIPSMTLTNLSSPRHIGKLPICLGRAASSAGAGSDEYG